MAEVFVHYVCTYEEARAILAGLDQDRFWVSNCGCREDRGTCRTSRHDVCLGFDPTASSGGTGMREITRAGVEEILREAEAKHLVARPFQDEGRTRVAGFCFCCPDCCWYFQHPGEGSCQKGASIERTDAARCTDCGACVDACYFGARQLDGGGLTVDREACYGCGLCLDACPEGCISIVPKTPVG